MQGFELLIGGFAASLTAVNLAACFFGALIGTLVGVLPGLGPTATMALLLPFTLAYGPTTGLIMMTGIWYGAMYGGSTTSVLVNIPGEAASVVTCLDGYAMAKNGRAGAALALVAGGSFIAGTIGILGLQFLAPLLGNAALAYDAAQTRSLLGGLSWDVTGAVGLDITGISSDRSGVPWRTLYNHERGTHQAMHRTTATLLHRALSRAGLQVSIEQLQGAR